MTATASQTAAPTDIGPLAWLLDQIGDNLQSARTTLARAAQQRADNPDRAVDVAALRSARMQVHQAGGAVELLGYFGAARLMQAAETALDRLMGHPAEFDDAALRTFESGFNALVEYLEAQRAGKNEPALKLFPQYRDLMTLARAERIHPADLWDHDWSWPQVPPSTDRTPLTADDRARFERALLALLRGVDTAHAAHSLGEVAWRAQNASSGPTAGLWWLARGVFEGLGAGLLAADAELKRLVNRLNLQLRSQLQGQSPAPQRLGHDLAFYCAQALHGAAHSSVPTPQLHAIDAEMHLSATAFADYQRSYFGLIDPAQVQQVRKRVQALRDGWAALAGHAQSYADPVRLGKLADLADSLAPLLRNLVDGSQVLPQALAGLFRSFAGNKDRVTPERALEAATAILFLDIAFAHFRPEEQQFLPRCRQLAERLSASAAGTPSAPLDSWMEELFRQSSETQTMGSVVQELRADMNTVEKVLDAYFRDPGKRADLDQVPPLLQQMRGVFSVLGVDVAAEALAYVRDSVDALIANPAPPTPSESDALAANIGALGFLVDMLAYQPELAKSLFTFDAERGELRTVALAPRRVAPPTLQQDLQAAARALVADAAAGLPPEQVQQRLATLRADSALAQLPQIAEQAAAEIDRLRAPAPEPAAAAAEPTAAPAPTAAAPQTPQPAVAPATPPAAAPVAPAPAVAPAAADEGEDELTAIFLEESREVIAAAREQDTLLREHPHDDRALAALRRAFHTLKGSSRMVGLAAYGEAAWALEQVFNQHIASQQPASGALLDLAQRALDRLQAWTEAIAAGHQDYDDSAGVIALAQRYRDGGDLSEAVPAPATARAPTVDAAPAASGFTAAAPATPDVAPAETAPMAAPAAAPARAAPQSAVQAEAPEVPPLPEVTEIIEAEAPLLPEVTEISAAEAAQAPLLPEVTEISEAEAAGELAPSEFPLEASAPAEPAETLDDALLLGAEPAPEAQVELPPLPSLPRAAEPEVSPAPVAPAAAEAPSPLAAAAEAPSAPAAAPTPPGAIDLAPLLGGIDLELSPPSAESAAPARPTDTAEPEPPTAAAPEAAPAPTPSPEPVAAAAPATERIAPAAPEAVAPASAAAPAPAEDVRQIGDLRVPTPLYNIFLGEADELSHRLDGAVRDWLAMPSAERAGDAAVVVHKLAGSSATVGLRAVADLAAQMEQTLERLAPLPEAALPPERHAVFDAACSDIRQLLHQFAAGFLKPAPESTLAQLQALAREGVSRAAERKDAGTRTAAAAPSAAQPAAAGAGPALVDAIDPDLFPIFEDEASELLPELAATLRRWEAQPADGAAATAAMRVLHTFKGSARMAGAMRLGEMAHQLESDIEAVAAGGRPSAAELSELLGRYDQISARFERLREAAQRGDGVLADHDEAPAAAPASAAAAAATSPAPSAAATPASPGGPEQASPAAPPAPAISAASATPDHLSVAALTTLQARTAAAQRLGSQPVRVRAQLLDRLVNQAGEISISRARLQNEVQAMRNAVRELGDNLDRLRQQVREVEIQAEAQMNEQVQAARDAHRDFDPLEFDRYTRTQELTRMMAETIDDLALVQATLNRLMRDVDDDMARQSRQTRDLQRDLLRTRMVEFDSLSERLYRTVRQAAKELGKQVRLDIRGGTIEIDRGVLDRMAGSFDHLLRNAVAHGIEPPAEREAKGKPAVGTITVHVRQEGNEVAIEVSDDGRGLDFAAIRAKAERLGLIAPGAAVSEDELAQLIFRPQFSSAQTTSEIAGRGVGLDVVRSEVANLGGQVRLDNQPGAGARFTLLLPLTTAITQVVLLRIHSAADAPQAQPTPSAAALHTVAVPGNLVELVLRLKPEQVEQAERTLTLDYHGQTVPFYWLGALLGQSGRSSQPLGKSVPAVIIRSANQRVAVQVDDVLGNQEVVIKNLGPQLSRVPGLAGLSVLPNGEALLIYNPVALAAVYGESAAALMRAAPARPPAPQQPAVEPAAPVAAPVATPVVTPVAALPAPGRLVMVVDDSTTVRRVTQRFLQRHGYTVMLAKDGLDALEQLQQSATLPDVMLLDIEMPRMDGFDLTRNIRADARLARLPIIMITSRIAEKHRSYATELGVNHYLGKPYAETELLRLIERYTAAPAAIAT